MTIKRTVNGKEIKITHAGYFYIDGVKQTPRKIDPFYYGRNVCNDESITDICHEWAFKNYEMGEL